MDDFYMEYREPSYSEILDNINLIKKEVDNLDQDSLIDEIGGIYYNFKGKESEKAQHLIFKAHADEILDDGEMQFLKNLYVVYHCIYAVVVDEPEEDEY